MPNAAEGAAGAALFVGSELTGVGFAPEALDWPFGIDSLTISKRPSSSIIFVLWCCAFLYLLRSVSRGGGYKTLAQGEQKMAFHLKQLIITKQITITGIENTKNSRKFGHARVCRKILGWVSPQKKLQKAKTEVFSLSAPSFFRRSAIVQHRS